MRFLHFSRKRQGDRTCQIFFRI